MTHKHTLQKLELTWIGKGEEPKLEPRILIESPDYSYWEGKDRGVPSPFGYSLYTSFMASQASKNASCLI